MMCLLLMIQSLAEHHWSSIPLIQVIIHLLKEQPHHTPFVQREQILKLINEMQQRGIIQPSASAWASPIVIVPKKDGTSRFCVNFRRVNAVTKKDVYPLPMIDDVLDTLGGSQYFSTLDLSSGYWQIELDPATRDQYKPSLHTAASTNLCICHSDYAMPRQHFNV